MFNVKKLAVAAAMLVAGSAFASNFRAADQVYVPVAGHAAGGSGTFISDVFLSNLSTDPVTVTVTASVLRFERNTSEMNVPLPPATCPAMGT